MSLLSFLRDCSAVEACVLACYFLQFVQNHSGVVIEKKVSSYWLDTYICMISILTFANVLSKLPKYNSCTVYFFVTSVTAIVKVTQSLELPYFLI